MLSTTPDMASSRKRAAVAEEILLWLDLNYELSEGVCLPRSLLYQHYLDHCFGRKTPPIGAAAFGKVSINYTTLPFFKKETSWEEEAIQTCLVSVSGSGYFFPRILIFVPFSSLTDGEEKIL